MRYLIGLLLSVVALVGCSTSASTDDSGDTPKQDQISEPDAVKNVTIVACVVDPTLRWPTAQLKITNPTSKPSDYIVEVAFESKDGKTQFDTGAAIANSVAPGQTAKADAQGAQEIPPGAAMTCRVTSATRTAA